MTMHAIQHYRETFTLALQPYFEMLQHKQEYDGQAESVRWIQEFIPLVLQSPAQYLGYDLPSALLTEQLVTEICDAYVQTLTLSGPVAVI